VDEHTAYMIGHTWLWWCEHCQRNHRVRLYPCPSCAGERYTPQPVSEKVALECGDDYWCDLCSEDGKETP